MATAGERYRANQRTADPSREEIESAPIGGPGSSGEPSRQRANTYLNNERLILGVLRSAIRRMRSTGRIDPDVLNAYAKIKSERTERENNYGVGMDGPTQRAERWLSSLDAAGQIPSIYSADWANMTRARNQALEEQGDSTMFLEDEIRGKRTASKSSQEPASPLDPPVQGQPDFSNQFDSPPPAFQYQAPGIPLRPEDEEEQKSAGLRNTFNSLFA